MKLYFKSADGTEKLIAEPINVKEVDEEMEKFMRDRGMKSYYQRFWEESGRIKFDVGSYTEFFYLEGMAVEEFVDALKMISKNKKEL